jgi:tripeptidyl-peptidase-1
MMRPIDGTLKETTCSIENGCGITSGGGFVGTWFNQTAPTWQKKHIERYLTENNASTFPGFPTNDTPGYNPTGRGFPDISAYADNFPTMKFPMYGVEGLGAEAGTSLAAPVMAGLFSLANEKLVEDGYEKIGYANPMLYWMGESCTDAFNDITDGNIQWGSDSNKCLYGFPAAPGWDAATGLGTINFEPFVACAKRYQDEVRGNPSGSPPMSTPSPSAKPSGSSPMTPTPTPSPSASVPRYASGVALLSVIAGLVGV